MKYTAISDAYLLVFDTLFDDERVLLDIIEGGRALYVHDKLLAGRKGGRSKLES